MGASPDFDEFIVARSGRLLRTAYLLLTPLGLLAEALVATAAGLAGYAGAVAPTMNRQSKRPPPRAAAAQE